MSESIETIFTKQIQDNEGIIHKVIGLYTDKDTDKADLYQEILLQTWKSFPNFKSESKFSTWLYRVCLNTALTFNKREKKHSHKEITVDSKIGVAEKNNENHELLYYLIKQLNEVDRMIITLHLDGYKNKEIAEITGMTVNNVNVKIYRIKQKLISEFKLEAHG